MKFKRNQEALALKNMIWRTPFIVEPGAQAEIDISDYTHGGVETKGRAPVNEITLCITEPDGSKLLYKLGCEANAKTVILNVDTLIPQQITGIPRQNTVPDQNAELKPVPFKGFIADSQILASLNCYLPEFDHSVCYLLALGLVKGEKPIYRFSPLQLIINKLVR